jgi:hypothetical protein
VPVVRTAVVPCRVSRGGRTTPGSRRHILEQSHTNTTPVHGTIFGPLFRALRESLHIPHADTLGFRDHTPEGTSLFGHRPAVTPHTERGWPETHRDSTAPKGIFVV